MHESPRSAGVFLCLRVESERVRSGEGEGKHSLKPPIAPELDAAWLRTAQTLPITIWTAYPDGRIEFVNKRWEELTGLPGEAIVANGWGPMIHPDDAEQAVAVYQRALQSGEPLCVDLRIRKASGAYTWVRSQADPMRDADGAIVRWFGVILDVDEVHRSTERFRRLAEAVPAIVWTADPRGWIEWYNRHWYEFTGQSPQEAIGWGWQSAQHPDDFLEVMRKWPKSIATGEPFEMEYRIRCHDGTFHWFLARVDPLRDEMGEVVRWYGTLVNIDLQRSALERTRRVAETLQDVFLPKVLPRLPNLKCDAVYLAAERDALVGGDWFDASLLPDGRIMFSIGDVAGHGLEASITVGRLRQAILTLAFRISDPGQILADLDTLLQFQEPGVVVTALVGFIDGDAKTITYASAGHPSPMIARKGDLTAVSLPLGDPPLGASFGGTFQTHRAAIQPDSILALYTDGMIEYSRDVIAAEAHLRAAVALFAGNTSVLRPAIAIKDLVLNEVTPSDDVALLVIQFTAIDSGADGELSGELEKTWRFHSSHAYSAHVARREVGAYFQRMGASAQEIFDAELVLGEILANTVEHAPGLVEVRVDWRKERPLVIVRDTGPGLRTASFALPRDNMSEDGRGLYLIRTLTENVTIRESPGYGTEIRVVLPFKRRLSPRDSTVAPT